MSTAASSSSGSSSTSNNNSTPRRHHTPGRRVVRTLNGEQLSISIPDNFHQQHLHLTQHLQQQQQQQFQQQPGSVSSMMVSPALPSPNFSNFMLTLSPLMQLSSPQPTMSPRDDMSATGGVPSNMTPMVSTADEIPFAFQASNDAPPTTTPATTSTQTAAAPPLAPPPLPTHALMPPPPPRVRPPREQEQHDQQHGQHHEHEHHHHHQQQHEEQHAHHQQQQEQHEQQQQQQQQQRLLQGEEEERDPHNHHLPAAQGSALGNGNGTLADKFHLMQMGVVDAGGLMEGKGSLLGPATPTMQGVVMEGYPRSLAMGMGGGAEAFGNSDGEEEEGEEEEGESGAEEGVFGGRLGRRVVHRHHAHRRGSEDGGEEEEIYEAEGGYISSSSSDGTKSTMEHLQHDQRDLHSSQHQPHYSTSPAASAFARRHGQGPSAAAVAAAAAAASSRSRGSSSSIHKKTGSSSGGGSNSASRPVRSAAAARRHSHTQEMRRSPPPGAMAGGLPHPQARVSPSGTMSVATGPKKCNCRKSKCLKLYCECFAVGAYCQDDCGCVDCNNTLAFEHVRTQAVDSILSRNPHAFTEKIQFIEAGATGAVAGTGGAGRRATLAGGLRGEGGETTVMGGMQGSAGGMLPTAAHVRGCNCKKSLCIKKYCECFFAGVYCGENCQCEGCQNNHEASAGVHAIKKRASGNATKQKQQQQQQQQLEASPSPSSGPPSLSPTHEMIETASL